MKICKELKSFLEAKHKFAFDVSGGCGIDTSLGVEPCMVTHGIWFRFCPFCGSEITRWMEGEGWHWAEKETPTPAHPLPREVEGIYQSFWKDIVEKNGVIDIEQVKKELADYSFVLSEVSKVYTHVTGGLLSKPNYHANGIISAADDHMNEVVQDALEDA